MSNASMKAQLRELAERSAREFSRTLQHIWSADLESFAMLQARSQSISTLEEAGRRFIADAFDLPSNQSILVDSFALVDDEIAWLITKLENQLLQRDHSSSRGLSNGQTMRSEINMIRSRLGELVRYRQMQTGPSLKLEEQLERRGRRPKHDWAGATNQVWGLIHRGDLTPKKQADIESALVDALSVDGAGPETSNVRKYARIIWTEYQRDI